MKVSQLKANPTNPRIIKDDKFNKLVESLRGFPEMMEKRPIVCVTDVDGKLFPLGGNMRLRAIQKLGMKDIPDTWVTLADDWTEEKRKEFTIKDNASFGEWNWDDLANEWDTDLLSDWGMDVPFTDDDIEEMKNPTNQSSENPFAIELDRESNYIVLKFDTDIDWIQAKTLFKLSSVASRRANGKPWSVGIGRVIDGALAIKNIQDES